MANNIAHLLVWNRITGKVVEFSKRDLDVLNIELKWIAPTLLVAGFVADQYREKTDAIRSRTTSAGWDDETLTTIVESPNTDNSRNLVSREISVIDVERNAPALTTRCDCLVGDLTPGVENGRAIQDPAAAVRFGVTFLERIGFSDYDLHRPLRHRAALSSRYTVKIIAANQSVHRVDTGALQPILGGNTVQWSPNHKQFVLVGVRGELTSEGVEFGRFRMDGPNAVEVSLADLDTSLPQEFWTIGPTVAWSSDDRLAILARRKGTPQQGRKDWWLETGDAFACLTCKMATVPAELIAAPGSGSFLGITLGHLWKISVIEASEDISSRFKGKIETISFVSGNNNEALLSAVIDGTRTVILLDLTSWRTTYLQLPDALAEVSAYSPQTHRLAFEKAHFSGAGVWLGFVDGSRSIELGSSVWRGERNEPVQTETRRLDYTGLDGTHLVGELDLPPESTAPGTKYPLIIVVYPGMRVSEKLEPTSRSVTIPPGINTQFDYNFKFLLSQGYALLFPDQPMPDGYFQEDPLVLLQNGVLPALDAAQSTGLIDSQRVGIIGHSFGGYAVYSMITQTTRFQAAVAMDGLCDLISDYGIFTPKRRSSVTWDDVADPETGQTGLGSRPWNDPQKYLRNSPLLFADRVETPLLIIHGDLDPVPVEQAEEFFTALQRENKRAKFIRFWGEGHLLTSGADVLYARTQIKGWFDQFLKAATTH